MNFCLQLWQLMQLSRRQRDFFTNIFKPRFSSDLLFGLFSHFYLFVEETASLSIFWEHFLFAASVNCPVIDNQRKWTKVGWGGWGVDGQGGGWVRNQKNEICSDGIWKIVHMWQIVFFLLLILLSFCFCMSWRWLILPYQSSHYVCVILFSFVCSVHFAI